MPGRKVESARFEPDNGFCELRVRRPRPADMAGVEDGLGRMAGADEWHQGYDIVRRSQTANGLGKLVGSRWFEAKSKVRNMLQPSTFWGVFMQSTVPNENSGKIAPINGVMPIFEGAVSLRQSRTYRHKNLLQDPNCFVQRADVSQLYARSGFLAAALHTGLQEYDSESLVFAPNPAAEKPGHPMRSQWQSPLAVILEVTGNEATEVLNREWTAGALDDELIDRFMWLKAGEIHYAGTQDA